MSGAVDASLEVGQARMQRLGSLIGLLVLLGSFRLLFPGDIRFVNDEPMLLAHALDANELGSFAWSGLTGTRGVSYGPVPTWFYQVALAITSDPVLIAALKILFVTAVTALALTMLARSIGGLVPGLGAFAFLSPYLWMYARDLWDNSFVIPWSAMLLATYARSLRDDRLRWPAACAVFATLCFLTHPMTLPLVASIVVHVGVGRWRAVVASPRRALGLAAVLGLCLVPSLVYLDQQTARSFAGFDLAPRPAHVLFAIDGMRIFSLSGFDYFIGPWQMGAIGSLATLVSLFSYVAAGYGLVLTVKAVRDADEARRQMASALLSALTLFVVLANGMSLSEHPHYYNGTWIVFFCLWWIGMSDLVRQAWARRLFMAHVAIMIVFLVGVASWIHANRGTRTLHYGATLENQMAVARELDRLGAAEAPESAAIGQRLFPHTIALLRRLQRRSSEGVDTPVSSRDDVRIVYADPEGGSGEIAVEVAPRQP